MQQVLFLADLVKLLQGKGHCNMGNLVVIYSTHSMGATIEFEHFARNAQR